MLDAETPTSPLPAAGQLQSPDGEVTGEDPGPALPMPAVRPARPKASVKPTRVSSRQKPTIFHKAHMDAVETVSVANGTVVAFSRTSPEKDTPNEDSAAVFPLWQGAAVLVVADGVGGMKDGSRASAAAIRAFRKVLSEVRQGTDLRNPILDAIQQANANILRHAAGSATTIAAVEVCDGKMRSYHVGDSIIMQVSERGVVKSLTLSHAPVSYAVEAGVLTEDEGLLHPDRNLISNVVGDRDMRIEIGPRRKLATQDTVLLASDGLCDNLTTDEIADLVRRNPLSSRIAKMVEIARERMSLTAFDDETIDLPGKPDDLTLLVYRKERRRKARKKSKGDVSGAGSLFSG